jgi:hypothetical protein
MLQIRLVCDEEQHHASKSAFIFLRAGLKLYVFPYSRMQLP